MAEWLRSDRVRTLFFYSAWVVVGLGVFMIFMLTPWFHQIETLPRGTIFLRILAFPLALLCAPASLIIWIGMMAFCAREDRSPVRSKIFWFVLFFTIGWFGSAAYFFRVYRKQVSEGQLVRHRPRTYRGAGFGFLPRANPESGWPSHRDVRRLGIRAAGIKRFWWTAQKREELGDVRGGPLSRTERGVRQPH